MNVFLIQPPDTPVAVGPLDSADGALDLFSPPWNLMSLQAFLQKHTRHICHFIDCRLFTELEAELVRALDHLSPPRIVVINCPILSLGQVTAVLDITKRHFPSMRTVLCGEYPSAYPEHVAEIHRADYALAGDPEPILRNLLDYLDVPQRLRRTPGLIMDDSLKIEPYWVNRLTRLALPDWKDIYWEDYSHEYYPHTRRAEMRLTRGHTRAPMDRAYGGAGAPLRQWPMDRIAALVSRCSHAEIKEVVLTDPPGFWSQDHLQEWVRQLLYIRNLQPWTLTLPPMPLEDDFISDLRESRCFRIEMVFPSCDRAVLSDYGIKTDWREWARTFQALKAKGVRVYPRYWIGNPEAPRGETDRILQAIRRLAIHEYRVEPFPFAIDSPLYEEHLDEWTAPVLDEWIRWARDPWFMQRPVPLWGGHESVAILKKQLKSIYAALHRSPTLVWARLRHKLHSRSLIETLEDKAIAFLQRNRKASTP